MARERVVKAPLLYPAFDGVHQAQPHQLEFHNSKAKVKVASWGIGGGKSETCAMEGFKWALRFPGKSGLVVAQTGPLLERTVVPKIKSVNERFLRAHGIPLILQYEKTRKIFHLINGHTIYLVPSDDPDKLRGPEYVWAWLEEFPVLLNQERVFAECMQRMRVEKDWCIFGSGSPIPGSWILKHVKDKIREGDPNYFLSRYASSVNKAVNMNNLEMLRSGMSADMWAWNVEANDEHMLKHAVYAGSFDLEKNVKNINPRIMREDTSGRWSLHYAVDWGDAQGHALGIMEDTVERKWYIVDDWALLDGGVEKSVKIVYDRIAKNAELWGRWPTFIVTDPTGRRWNALLRRRVQHLPHTVVRSIGWHRRDQTTWGVELVKASLLNADGQRSLFVAQHVAAFEINRDGGRGSYQGLQRYAYPVDRDGNILSGKPKDDNYWTHGMDALRMFFMHANPLRPGAADGQLRIY